MKITKHLLVLGLLIQVASPLTLRASSSHHFPGQARAAQSYYASDPQGTAEGGFGLNFHADRFDATRALPGFRARNVAPSLLLTPFSARMAAALSVPFALLAQASIEPQIESFLKLIQLLLLPVIVCLIIYGAWCIHNGEVSKGVLAIVGALILALAVPIAKILFGL
ncbi:MAG TPA: hypothetical protein PKM43_08525 [Verrucomicrobiota bacterium]|nr:hypothetical protein [Verrucomicrobiota bacterium]